MYISDVLMQFFEQNDNLVNNDDIEGLLEAAEEFNDKNYRESEETFDCEELFAVLAEICPEEVIQHMFKTDEENFINVKIDFDVLASRLENRDISKENIAKILLGEYFEEIMHWDVSYEEREYFNATINEERYGLTIDQKNRDSFEKTYNVKLEDVLKDLREENYTEAADVLREALWAAISDAILNSYDNQVENLLKSSIEEALEHVHKKASLDYDFDHNLITFKIPNEYVLDNLKEKTFFNSYFNDWDNIDYSENIDELLLDELSSHFYFNNDAINSADLTDDEFNDALSSHI